MRVIFPLLVPAVFASLLLSFTISFTDVVMSNFASGVGTTTLPVYVFGLLKVGVSPEINALGTVLVLGTFLIIGLIGIRQIASFMASHSGVARDGAVDLGESSSDSM
jgi:ABC-type spermidine/putrescine transport system permease subunit II